MITSLTNPAAQTADRRASRAGWMAIDQAINSAFNLTLGAGASWALSTTAFGMFAVMFAAYLLIRGAYRSLVCEPILILHADDPFDQLPTATKLALITGAGLSVALIVISILSGTIDTSIAVLAGGLTAVLLGTDAGRITRIRAGQPNHAALISGALLLGVIGSLALTASGVWPGSGLASFLTVVTVGVIPAALVAGAPVVARRARTRGTSAVTWIRERHRTGLPLLADFGASAALSSFSVFALAGVSLVEAGAYRAGQMVAAPIHMLYVTVGQYIVTELARSDRHDLDAQPVRQAMAFMALIGLTCIAAIALGADLLAGVLGDTAAAARPVLVPMALFAVASFPSVAGSAVLRAQNQTTSVLARRVASLPIQIVAVGAGVWRHSALDMAVFGAVALILGSVVWVGPLRGAFSATPASIDPEPPTPSTH